MPPPQQQHRAQRQLGPRGTGAAAAPREACGAAAAGGATAGGARAGARAAASNASKEKAEGGAAGGGVLQVAHGMSQLSPDGRLAAFASGTAVVVCAVPGGEGEALKVVRRMSCLDSVDVLEWSADSSLLLCAQLKRATVQCFSVANAAWSARATEGVAGLVWATFAPDSQHVLTVADFSLHCTVWSLRAPAQQWCIENPKLPGAAGLRFSECGQFLAVLHRRECRDSIAVYSCATWKPLSHFAIATADCEELQWSPAGDAIAVRESALQYCVLAYCPSSGQLLGRFSAYDNALGARAMSWAPAGDLLAVGSFDGTARVLCSASWRPVLTCEHPATLPSRLPALHLVPDDSAAAAVAAATAAAPAAPAGPAHAPQAAAAAAARALAAPKEAAEERSENVSGNAPAAASPPLIMAASHALVVAAGGDAPGVHRFRAVRPDAKRDLPRCGVSALSWSLDGEFLATKDEDKPGTVWVWRRARLEPYAVLEFAGTVHGFKWDPARPRLAIAHGAPYASVWAPAADSQFTLDKALPLQLAGQPEWAEPALGVRWSAAGDLLLLMSKSLGAFALPPSPCV